MRPGLVAPVLDPDFLLARLEELRSGPTARRGLARLAASIAPHAMRAIPPRDYAAMKADLEHASRTLPRATGSGPAAVHLSRNPGVSAFQTVLTQCVEARLDELAEPLGPGEDRFREWVDAMGGLFRPFGPCDPLWVETEVSALIASYVGRAAFPDEHPEPVAVGDRVRVVLVGDWATGLDGAQRVAQQIRTLLGDQSADNLERHVIHLGDTYYSGWREEYEARFLRFWPVDPGSIVASWSLNGNHDMYSGGRGYFDCLLKDARFARQRGLSHFCLENSAWRIIGLDSAYADHDLAGTQAQWLGELVADESRSTMLFTHHQPFSAYEAVDAPLAGKVQQGLAGRHLDAWIWGHEHRCAVYKLPPQLIFRRPPNPTHPLYDDVAGYTAIVGHGGVPNLLPEAPSAPPLGVEWEYDGSYVTGEDRWGLCGFAVLDFDGPTVTISFYDENGPVARAPDVLPVPPLAAAPTVPKEDTVVSQTDAPTVVSEGSLRGSLVALLTPFFAGFAGWLAGLVAKNIPGVTLDKNQIVAFMVAVTTVGLGAAYKWLQGWQSHEARVSAGTSVPVKPVSQ